MDPVYSRNLDEIIGIIQYKKECIVRMLKNKFECDIDYIKIPSNHQKKNGRPANNIILTQRCFDQVLLIAKLGARKNIVNVPNVDIIKRYMPKEIEILNFICEVFSPMFRLEREYKILEYRVDLYIFDINLVVECDEFGHKDRDREKDITRQYEIEKHIGCSFFRFNPDDTDFKLSSIISKIMSLLITHRVSST